MPELRLGRRIAVDFGIARIGIAISSVDGLICSPLATVVNDMHAFDNILRLVAENNVFEAYIGLPLNLQGERTRSTESAIEFAKELNSLAAVPIRLIDERMSTRAAQGQLLASGKNTKQSKGIIDAAAASLILESALSFEKTTGKTPGHDVTEY